jgi:protein Mpv17
MKLATRPILTQSITTAVLFATGDSIAQQAVEKKGIQKHDFARTGRMALYGGGACLSYYALPLHIEERETKLI